MGGGFTVDLPFNSGCANTVGNKVVTFQPQRLTVF